MPMYTKFSGAFLAPLLLELSFKSIFVLSIQTAHASFITRAPQGVPSHKMQPFSSPKGGVMVPGVPCVDRGNWGQDLALCEYCGDFLARIAGLILRCHIQRCRSFSEGVSPRIIVLERQPGKQSLCLKRSREITTEPIAE